ncbi:Uncharacterised protein [BD1-7 clade bacterium]|uniref:BIG2 domain-containing protein n=1 Tax=BD1-7 clade bacterium TaxID=2029982 RepID=A0A5S9PMT7_9GAMM|nr:Uncharacterised protein [BD1-7 clade bacterium]
MRTRLLIMSLFTALTMLGCENSGTGFPRGSCDAPGKPACPDYPIQLIIEPDNTELATGTSLQYKAIAVYNAAGKVDVTDKVTWQTANTDIASFNDDGQLQANIPGTTQVNGQLPPQVRGASTLRDSAQITVADKALSQLKMLPASSIILTDIQVQLSTIATFDDGSLQNVSDSAQWVSFVPQVASVNQTGLVTGQLPGATDVSANYANETVMAEIDVSGLMPRELSITPIVFTLPQGFKQAFQAILVLEDGATLDVTNQVDWAIIDESIARISEDGVATALKPGVTGVRARIVFDSRTELMVTPLTVTNATLTEFAVQPEGIELPEQQKQEFAAIATFSDGSTLDVSRDAIWRISNPAHAFVTNSFANAGVVKARAAGDTLVGATIDNTEDFVDVDVSDATLTGLTISPTTADTPANTRVDYQAIAQFSDMSSLDVTPYVSWNSTNTGVAIIDNAGIATAILPGFSNITANYQGQTATTTLDVNTASLTSLDIEPDDATLLPGASRQYVLTASYSNGTTANVTDDAAWIVDDTNIVQIAPAGRFAGIAKAIEPGSATITAIFSTLEQTVPVTVENPAAP